MKGDVFWSRSTRDGRATANVLWYPPPHNCWRIEVVGLDLDGDLQNLTALEALDLGNLLCGAVAVIPSGGPI